MRFCSTELKLQVEIMYEKKVKVEIEFTFLFFYFFACKSNSVQSYQEFIKNDFQFLMFLLKN